MHNRQDSLDAIAAAISAVAMQIRSPPGARILQFASGEAPPGVTACLLHRLRFELVACEAFGACEAAGEVEAALEQPSCAARNQPWLRPALPAAQLVQTLRVGHRRRRRPLRSQEHLQRGRCRSRLPRRARLGKLFDEPSAPSLGTPGVRLAAPTLAGEATPWPMQPRPQPRLIRNAAQTGDSAARPKLQLALK